MLFFRNFRIRWNLENYEIARELYRDWRNRYVIDTKITERRRNNGMAYERNQMNRYVNNLLRLGLEFDKWYTLPNGKQFIIYSDKKSSLERKIWVRD